MAKTNAAPLSPRPRHIAKQAPAKAKTYSTSHIFKKKPQKAPDAHGRGNVVWADKLGRNWLRKVEQKERERQKNAREMHPLASEFNEKLSNSRSTILEKSLSALDIASGNLQTRLDTTSHALNASMGPLVEFHNIHLRPPLGETKIFKTFVSQSKAAGTEKGGSQVTKQHTTTLSTSMNKFRDRIAAQKQELGALKKEWDAVQAEICTFKIDWEKESAEEERSLKAEIDDHLKGWQEEIQAATEASVKRCREIDEAFVKKKRKAAATLEKLMADNDDD